MSSLIVSLKKPQTIKVKMGQICPLTAQWNNINIISQNIPTFEGEYHIIPEPFEEQKLQTAGKQLKEDITISKIPYYDVSNESGSTIYIGSEI